MGEIIHVKVDDVEKLHKNEHKDYEFYKRELVKKGSGDCIIAQYEVPPGKSPFPYHYHVKNEESFYILSGKGLLRTPEGEREVNGGEFMHFPKGESGAHKLTNISENENLVYIDFDTDNDLEVAFYPDAGKVGIWGEGINRLYMEENDVEYYEGE